MQATTRRAALIGSTALAGAMLLAGCGSSTTATAPVAVASAPATFAPAPAPSAPMASAPVASSPAEIPAARVEAAWTCAREGDEVTCTCDGVEAECKGSVAKPSQAKGATGKVRWFNDSYGFGFIAPSEGGADIFAHFSGITSPGFKTLKDGQCVSFEVTNGPKGKQASNILPDSC